MNNPTAFVGLDIGGTLLKVLAFDRDAKLLTEQSVPTEDDGTPSWLNRARAAVAGVLAGCPSPAVVGVAAPGLPAPDGRSICAMPGRLRGLEGLNWQQWL